MPLPLGTTLPWSWGKRHEIEFTAYDFDDKTALKICKTLNTMCAFLNDTKNETTEGIVLSFDKTALESLSSEEGPKIRDNLLRKIEQKATHSFGYKTFVNHFKVENASTTDNVVFSFKHHTDGSCTSCEYIYPFTFMHSQFYWSLLTQINEQSIIDIPSDTFQEMDFSESEDETTDDVSVENPLSKMKFTLNEKPQDLRENDKTQFKYLNDSKSKNTTLADRIVNKGNKLSQTVSAFANKNGGSILYMVLTTRRTK